MEEHLFCPCFNISRQQCEAEPRQSLSRDMMATTCCGNWKECRLYLRSHLPLTAILPEKRFKREVEKTEAIAV